MSPGATIRTRRYVSAPAGTYPRPSAAPGTQPASGRPVGKAPALAGLDEPAQRPAIQFPLGDAAPSGVVDEPLPLAEPLFDRQAAEVSTPSAVESGVKDARPASRGSRGLVILVSGLAGILFGAVAGLALLASMEPARWTERFLDPIGLWSSTDDPLIRASAIMIVAGCGLIGALLPLRLRR